MNKLTFILMLLLLGASCKAKTKAVDSCGDGFRDPEEQCDGNVEENTCESLGYYNFVGTLRCTANCKFDVQDCGGRCGDDTVNANEGEECDGIQLSGQSCQSLGFTGGVITCGADCMLDVSQCVTTCGNGYLEGEETCDDGNRFEEDGCDADCQVESGWACTDLAPSDCEPICQDGRALGDEVCDQADLRGETCVHLGYHGGDLACSAECTLDPGPCIAEGSCGDLIVQVSYGEECDSQNLNGANCYSFGLDGGSLVCDGLCRFDFSLCNAIEFACGDDLDNDGDGLFDCADQDCDGHVIVGGWTCESPDERTCNDGFDNDANGLVDCADPGCEGVFGPGGVVCQTTETICDDGLDNDGDLIVDCDDPSCNGLMGPGGVACHNIADLTGYRVDLYQNGQLKHTVDLSGTYTRGKYLVIARNTVDIVSWSLLFNPPLLITETENIVFFHDTHDVWQMNDSNDDSARLFDAGGVQIDLAQNPANAISIRQADGTWVMGYTTPGAASAPPSLPGYTAPIYCYQIGEASTTNSRLSQYPGNFVMLYIP